MNERALTLDWHSSDIGSDDINNDAAEVWHGLNAQPKRLPCRLFYDDTGSRLFERITELPEYYLARTELGILKQHRFEMLEDVGPNAAVVEWGSGASLKTRLLLNALLSPRVYVPIDVSEEILMRATKKLAADFPTIEVRPMVANYLEPLTLPLSEAERERPIISFFPGSTLGNFDPDAAVDFLSTIRAACGKRQRLIIGADMEKSPQVLEAAYNDRTGVTAEFNLNILKVVNTRFGANFDLTQFSHSAIYRAQHHRIEMRLLSNKAQTVSLPQGKITFDEGEPIVTEHCYKFSPQRLDLLAQRAGFAVTRTWTDRQGLFSVHILRPF